MRLKSNKLRVKFIFFAQSNQMFVFIIVDSLLYVLLSLVGQVLIPS